MKNRTHRYTNRTSRAQTWKVYLYYEDEDNLGDFDDDLDDDIFTHITSLSSESEPSPVELELSLPNEEANLIHADPQSSIGLNNYTSRSHWYWPQNRLSTWYNLRYKAINGLIPASTSFYLLCWYLNF